MHTHTGGKKQKRKTGVETPNRFIVFVFFCVHLFEFHSKISITHNEGF